MCKLAKGLILVALSLPAALSAQNPFAGTWKTVPLSNHLQPSFRRTVFGRNLEDGKAS